MELMCQHCGGTFNARRRTAKFCSVGCTSKGLVSRNKMRQKLLPLDRADTKSGKRRRLLHCLADKYGWVCWYCGQSLKGMQIHIDHVVPRCKGGPDDLSNYALACEFCNHAKQDHDIDVFLAWLDGIRFGKAWTPLRDGRISRGYGD